MGFGIGNMSPDSPTEAVAIISDLDYPDWLSEGTHFVNFRVCSMSPDSPTEAVAIITDLDYLISYEMQPTL